MDTKAFLEMMSLQRHDFLNHLQVISGLVQLNKGDRVREYIRQVSADMEKLSRVSHLGVPEVAAALLAGFMRAERNQVRVSLEVTTGMSGCPVPGPVLTEVIEKAFDRSLACAAHVSEGDCVLKVSVAENGKNYMLRMAFPNPPGYVAEGAGLSGAGEKIAAHGGRIDMAVSGSGGEITVLFPRQGPGEDYLGA